MLHDSVPGRARLLVHAPRDGAWNMAVDEVLLLASGRDATCALRFYEWSEPTLSLGYFQCHAQRACHAPSRDCPLVRRSSGGGAILHDRELTYSLTLPLGDPLARDAGALYQLVHRSLIEALGTLGVAAKLWAGPRAARESAEPFLCFGRRATGDVVIGETKIAGSAQRRHRGALLQHGSVLLAASRYAPQLPGLERFLGREIAADALRETWLPRLATSLPLSWQCDALALAEEGAALSLAREKYGCDDWSLRR